MTTSARATSERTASPLFMGHPAFRDVPFLLEVPGFEGKGPDQRNVDLLKDIRRRVGAAP